LPDFDLHCPLPSLPLVFKTELATIPAQVPYLKSPAGAADWGARLGNERPRIGLVWSGNPGHKRDRERSIPFYALMPLFDLDATFVSLQKEVRAADAAVLKQAGKVIDVADALATFADTAALVSQLDLVISADTSVAHLSGALGRPLWLLLPQLPDWRWLLDRDDSPWYPTARLFRQDAARAWGPVVARVRAALEEMMAGSVP
jgi:ADP-heptose:LPS heptosyltransferase